MIPFPRWSPFLALSMIATLGCPSGDNNGPGPTPVTVDRVTVSPAAVNLLVGAQQTLSATALASNGSTIAGKAAAWSSNNTSAATVSATTGLVTAVGAGTAVITAVIDGRTGQATAQVTVPTQRLTVTTSGTGSGTVTSSPAGISCSRAAGVQTGTCVFDFPQGSVVTLTATTAMPEVQFHSWNGANCASLQACQVTMNQPVQVGPRFERLHLLTIAATGNGAGTITAPEATLTCTWTNGQLTPGCFRSLAEGTVVVLTATASAGSQFAGWSGGGCSGTGTCQVTITQAQTVTAMFLGPSTLTVTVNGAGRVTSSPAGIDCQRAEGGAQTGSCTAVFSPATVVTLNFQGAADHGFGGWSGSCPGTTGACTVTMSVDRAVTAVFHRLWPLTIWSGGLGSGTVMSAPSSVNCVIINGALTGPACGVVFPAGTVVTLTAAPAEGMGFAGWAGGVCTGTSPCQVTMTQGIQVTAAFAPLVPVTVVTAGDGTGTVTGSPAGINCTRTGSVQSGVCGTSYPQGTAVTLTAQAAAGSTFTGWNGEGCSGTGACIVQATQARTVTATFSAAGSNLSLTVLISGTGSGTITSTPAGIQCVSTAGVASGTCSAFFPTNTQVRLDRQLASGMLSAGWDGGCFGNMHCVLTMNANRSVTAYLIPASGALGIGFGPEQFVLVNPGTFQMGSSTGFPDEVVRSVTITQAFRIQRTEVTQSQWVTIMGGSMTTFSQCFSNCPAWNVSWNQVQAFLAALNAWDPGKNYRLPTEAEWEYAARAGTTGDYGGTGNVETMAWYSLNSLGAHWPVARKAANAWGLYDMHGNVGEWVRDWYGGYAPGPQVDPLGPPTGTWRVIRGGSYSLDAQYVRSAYRQAGDPGSMYSNVGFRLIRNP